MTATSLRLAARSDATRLARFIIDRCACAEQRCLMTWAGESFTDCERELLQCLGDTTRFALCLEQDAIVAALGVDVFASNPVAYLKGPLTLQRAQLHVPALWSQLLTTLPSSVTRLSAYLDHRYPWGVQFWQRYGLEIAKTSLVFEWAARPLSPQRAPSCRVLGLDRSTASSLASLHRAAFPAATLDIEELLADDSCERALIAVQPSGMPVGYVIYTRQEVQAEVTYMAVAPQARRLGIGRHLLSAALCELADHGVARVLLSVDDGNANARSLYESLGFTLKFTGVALSGTLAR